jgi:outer membrane protein assembly factor BamB
MNIRLRVLLVLGLVAVLALGQGLWAQLKSAPGDWPGWRGPDRTGLSPETGLLKQWPKGGPPLAWKITGLGTGYSTPALAGGRIYVLGTKGNIEHVFALDVKDGKQVWTGKVGQMSRGGNFPGPRSTPTVDGDHVYALGSDGKLVCLTVASGDLVWSKDLRADFQGRTGFWDYSESPLIDGDVLVCTPGGESATMVALNKKDGKVIWKAPVTGLVMKARPNPFAKGKGGKSKGGKGKMFGGGPPSYSQVGHSSVVAADIGGVHQYVQFLCGGVVGIAAKDGKLLWHYDDPASQTNCSTPLVHGDAVFAASGYGTGGGRANIKVSDGTFKSEPAFFVKSLQNHHGGMVLVGDHVYGTGAAALLCVSFKDGEVAWQERGVGKGSVCFADGHIYHRGENGGVALVEATPAGYKEKGRFMQPDRSEKKAWPHPVVAGGKLYLRDWDALFCYDVKEK